MSTPRPERESIEERSIGPHIWPNTVGFYGFSAKRLGSDDPASIAEIVVFRSVEPGIPKLLTARTHLPPKSIIIWGHYTLSEGV